MIFWKEWRRLQARFFILAGFYIITVLIIDLGPFSAGVDSFIFEVAPILMITWGVSLLLVPVILGMDAYVGERDEETEDFLFSKPLPLHRLLLAKVGIRLLLTLVIIGVSLAILLIRTERMVPSLYLGTRPYLVWYVISSLIVALLIVLMVTIAVSVRAPYQSTALIIGGSLGTAIAAFPVLNRTDMLQALQAPWGNFWILMIILIMTTCAACWGLGNKEVARSSR